MREYLDEEGFDKPAGEDSNVGGDDVKLEGLEDLAQLHHCVCSFAACQAHHHRLLSHACHPYLQFQFPILITTTA